MVSGIGKQVDADLMDMTKLSKYNDGVRLVLLHIDDFSRFIRTVPLESKTDKWPEPLKLYLGMEVRQSEM